MARRARGVAGELLEGPFGTIVENLLDLYGWRWFHAPDNRPSGRTGRVQRVRPGFPDYVALRGNELLFIELKTERGRLGPGQREWLDELGELARHAEGLALAATAAAGERKHRAPVEVYLWRPSDLERINYRLSRGQHRHPVTALA